MKTIKLSLITALLSLTFACKSKKQTSGSTNTAKTASTTMTCPTSVSFGSSGGGIDGKAYENIKQLLDTQKIKYTEERKGREGETKMCIDASNLSRTDNETLVKSLKGIAAAGQLVSVSTN